MEHDALKLFVKSTEEFESRFRKVMVGLSGPKTQDGHEYVEYLNGIARGRPWAAYPIAERAIAATFENLKVAFPDDQNPGVLQWRVKPEIDYFEKRADGRSGWVTYCRFAVTP